MEFGNGKGHSFEPGRIYYSDTLLLMANLEKKLFRQTFAKRDMAWQEKT